MGKCVKYSYHPITYCTTLTLDEYGITLETLDKKMKGNMYLWYEVYYGTSYILIKDNRTYNTYYTYAKDMCISNLSILIHDLIVMGCDISFLLDTNKHNKTMKDLIHKVSTDMSMFLRPNALYSIIPVSYMPLQTNPSITYNVNAPVRIFDYIVHDGHYNVNKILAIPPIRTIYSIISKYVVYV